MNKIEKLKILIEEAKADETFARKYNYWTVNRKRNPDSEWLLEQLKSAVGEVRLKEFLEGVNE